MTSPQDPTHITSPHLSEPNPGSGPASPAHPSEQTVQTLSLSQLLRRAVVGARGQKLGGRVVDVIVRLRGTDYPLVTGLVAELGGRWVFVLADMVIDWDTDEVSLSSPRVDLRAFQRREGEVLLRADILGHRLIDIPRARLVRAYDLELAHTPAGLVLAGVDTRPTRWWHRLLRHVTSASGHHGDDDPREAGVRGCRDWKAFEALIGHQPTVLTRRMGGRLRRLKAPQIADLLEQASRKEQTELLDQVHADPELEADVFEELDDDRQSRLLRDRSDQDIAAVLARMRADNAADAITDLPQHRRQPVLDLLPPGQRTKVTALLAYNPTSAGGLMGLDYLALPRDTPVAAALERVRTAYTLQPEALTTIFSLDKHQRLRGAANLVTLVQAAPSSQLRDITDSDPIRVHPDADLIDVALLMTDYNLLNLPVVDDNDQLLGVITVDDALESTVPRNWRRREPTPQPDSPDDPDQTSPTDPHPGTHPGAATSTAPHS